MHSSCEHLRIFCLRFSEMQHRNVCRSRQDTVLINENSVELVVEICLDVAKDDPFKVGDLSDELESHFFWLRTTDNKDINAILVRCGCMRPLLLLRVARALPNCFQTMRPLHWISMKFVFSNTRLSHTCFFKRIQLINCCRSFTTVVSSGATWQCQGAYPRKVSFSSDMAAAVQEECRLRHNSTDYSSSRCQESSLVVCECKSARRCHPKLSW